MTNHRRLKTWPRDVLALAILALACVLLRTPSLGIVTLNPDESQYAATATYLASTGTSAAALPYFIPGIFIVFKAMTQLFGAYPMFEVRLLVQLLCLGMAALLYVLVRSETNRGCGLLSGLVFVHLVMPYEGLSVNREWFAGALVLAGVGIWFLAERHRGHRSHAWLLFACGVLTGTALWFKLQAAYLVLPVPAVLLWQALRERRPTRVVRSIGPLFAGGLLSGVVLLLPLWLAGTLGEFMAYFGDSWDHYVFPDDQVNGPASSGVLLTYAREFYWTQTYRLLLMATYLFGAACLISAARQLFAKNARLPFLARPGVSVFAAYLFASMLCVQLGGRFFNHYFLLIVPPVAALAGFAVYHFAGSEWKQGRGLWLALGLLVLLLLDRGAAVGNALPVLLKHWPVALTLYVVLLLAVLAIWLVKPRKLAGAAVAALICVQAGVLIVQQQRAEIPGNMTYRQHSFDALVEYIDGTAARGDRLFVWGWAPEIYSLARIEAASHITIGQFLVNDYEATPLWGTVDPFWSGLLMKDLGTRPPRFIVDASEHSWSMTDKRVYDLARYPDFGLVRLLERDYVLTRRLDGCDVYERGDVAPGL